jgi:hypothetical protein
MNVDIHLMQQWFIRVSYHNSRVFLRSTMTGII